MRRIYHRFPQRCDLTFDIDRPFTEVIRCIVRLDNTHRTSHEGEDLIKVKYAVDVAENRISFAPVSQFSNLPENITETADFRIILHEILLTPEKRLPISENRFFLRVHDAGGVCECFAVKDGSSGKMDAMDLKQVIQEACR
jgi:hypothetical protein